MTQYQSTNILDMIEEFGEESVQAILSEFLCPQNNEIQTFVRDKAIVFAKQRMAITYLVFDDEATLIGIFTLTHKSITINAGEMSKSVMRRFERHSKLDEKTNSFTVSAFLIAQFGKNYQYSPNGNLSGDELMDTTMKVLKDIQKEIGGGIVYLDSEDNPFLLSFYQKQGIDFRKFGERTSETDQVKYIQLFKAL